MPTGIYDRTKSKPNNGCFQKGHAVLDEWKEKAKIATIEALKGKKQSKEHIEKRKKAREGYRHSEETKEKIRKAKKANPVRYWLGKKRPEQSGENCYNWKGGDVEKTCEECGKKFIISRGRENSGKNRFCSKECYWKYSDNGLSKESHKIRESVEYKQWRTKVYERDNYQCQMPGCDDSEKYLNAHHIKTFKKYPDLIFSVNNGITLCKKCHLSMLYKEEQYENLFKKVINI